MAYSSPALLLVGAAQNLVLGSASLALVGKRDCDNAWEIDDDHLNYDETGLW